MPDFPLKAICSVNNPFDIWLSINLMRGKVYEKHLAKELRSNLVIRDYYQQSEAEKKVYSEMVKKFNLDMAKLKTLETWRDFDEEFTIKVNPKFGCAA